MHTSLSLHFIDVQYLDMFRALLAHPQEALPERRIGDCCVQLGWSQGMGRLPEKTHPETNPHLQLHTIVTNSAFL
jgi:hypothetical protein